MCQRKKIKFKDDYRKQPHRTLWDVCNSRLFNKEIKVANYIMQHREVAGEHALKAGIPITVLKGNQIVRLEPDGKETILASLLKKQGFITVSQTNYKLK